MRPSAPPEPPLTDPDRLAAVEATGLFHARTEPAFDRLARVACRALDGAFALVSLLGRDTQIAKGRAGTDFDAGAVLEGICQYTVAEGRALAIEDATVDERVCDLAVVREAGVQAYLGVPVVAPGGAVVGSFAVCDTRPREWSDDDAAMLADLADAVSSGIEARVALRVRAEAADDARDASRARFQALFDGIPQLTGLLAPDGTVVEANQTALAFCGLSREQVIGRPLWESFSLPEGMEARHRDALARAAGDEGVRYEETVRDADGREHTLDVRLRWAPGSDGLLLLEGRDVTEAARLRRVQTSMLAGQSGTWDLDLATSLLSTEGSVDALHGLDPAGAPWSIEAYFATVHPDDHDRARAAFDRAIQEGGPLAIEYRLVHPDGSVRWVQTQGAVVDSGGGRFVGAITDVTGQRREAEAAARSVARLQSALNAAALGTWDLDPDAGWVHWDARARAFFGFDSALVPLSDALARIHPDDLPDVEAALDAALAPGTDGLYDVEYRVTVDGRPLRWVRARGQAVQGEDGRPRVLTGVVQDTTDRKGAEEALRRREAYARGLFESNPDCVKLLGLDGRLLGISNNGCRLMEIDDPAAAVGRPWPDLWPDPSLPAAAVVEAGETGRAHFSAFCPTAKGAPRWWDVIVARVTNPETGEDVLLSVQRDVTDRHHAEARTRASEDRIRRLFRQVPAFISIHEGADHVLTFTNDLLEASLGGRAVLGLPLREAFADLDAGDLFDRFDRVYRSAEADVLTEFAATYGRGGTGADPTGWFTQIIQPWLGPDGEVAGVMAFTYDVTEQVQARQRIQERDAQKAVLIALLGHWRTETDPRAILTAAVEAVGRHLGAHRVGVFEAIDQDPFTVGIGPSWSDGPLPPLSGTLPTDRWGAAYVEEVQRGQTLATEDTASDALAAEAAFGEIGVRSAISAPVLRDGQWVAGLYVHHAVPRAWTAAETAFVRDVAEQTWDAVERARAETALRESEARLSAVLNALPVGVVIADAQGRVVRDNAANRELWGVPPKTESWEGYADWVGYWPDSGRRLAAGEWAMARALRDGETARGELVEIEPFGGGPRRTMLNNAAPIRDPDGRITGGVVAQLDVTDQRVVQRALAENEARFEAILDATDTVIYAKDLEGRYTLVNRAWSALTGGGEAEALGRRDADFFPAKAAEMYGEHDRAVAATGHPIQFEESAEIDGEDRTFISVKFPVRDADGAVTAIGGVSTDITPLRRAAEALVTSEQRFRTTFENAAVGIAHVGLDGQWLRVNARLSAVVGYSPDELLARTFQDITHPDDLDADLALFGRLLAGEIDHYQIEKRYLHRDGHIVWINLTVAPNRTAEGAMDYAISVVEDISDRKAAEEALRRLNDELEDRVDARTAELERSNAELDQFAYVASHDLKAPIRAIDSLATWIAEDASDALPEESARHLALLQSRARRMEGLLDSLLTYSRAGRREAAPEPVDTRALVQDAVATVAPPRGFDVRLEGSFPEVVSARAPLELVLRNLIGNAIKHHDRPDGRVTVSAETDGTWATVSVSDDGPGIAPEYLDRIFGLFQTLRPRDEIEGSGMGLAIVKKTVEARGGHIAVRSEPGAGATFSFTWPAHS